MKQFCLRRTQYLILAGFSFFILEATAQENSDLDLIPRSIPKSSTKQILDNDRTSYKQKFFVEESGSFWANKQNLLVPISVNQANNQSLTSFDERSDYRSEMGWSLHASDRFNLIFEDDIVYPNQANFRNDLRELSINQELPNNLFIEIGRINTRNGVSLGYNPTDFFKSRSAVLQTSIDPSATRENRLGTVQFKMQKLFEHSSVTFVGSPFLQPASAIFNSPTSTFDPRLGQTNQSNRLLLGYSWEFQDFSPQWLYFNDELGSHLGFNLSHVIGSNLVLYAEWAGCNTQNLTARAIQFGQSTGNLPGVAPNVPQTNTASSFQNDASLGFSWTSSEKYSLNVEYHFHQSGFTAADFNNWINLGSGNALLSSQLWYIRQYANDQQEPLMQNEIFLRLDYPDLWVRGFNLDWVAFINSNDASTTTQLALQYFYSDRWTMSSYLTALLGNSGSEKGSLTVAESLSFKLSYYF